MMANIPWERYEAENEAARVAAYEAAQAPAIRTVPDDFDQLLTLVISYGAARFEAGYRFAHPGIDDRARAVTKQGNIALDQIATLITRLQRKAGGGL